MDSKLVDEVRRLLKERHYGISFRQLEEETSIPAGWIRRVQYGHIVEPSCPRIEQLYEHLSGKKLNI